MKFSAKKIPTSYKLPLVILLFELIGVWFLFKTAYSKDEPLSIYYQKIPSMENIFPDKEDKINAIIRDYTNKIPGDYALYIKNLKNGQTYTLNPQKVFAAASIYKLAILYKVYEDLENGKLDKNDVLTTDKYLLDQKFATNNLPQENKKNTEISYTVELATKLMIRISDNYAAWLLAEKVGWANTQNSLKKINILGFDLTSKESPKVNAYSVGQLLEKMYKKEIISRQASEEMIDILISQSINERIPKLLPPDVKVAHKTGELDGIRHDAGIVFGRNGDYIFVFLSETNSPVEASENMALASREIFDVLEN